MRIMTKGGVWKNTEVRKFLFLSDSSNGRRCRWLPLSSCSLSFFNLDLFPKKNDSTG